MKTNKISWIYQFKFGSPFGLGTLVLPSAVCSTPIYQRY